VGQGGGGGIKVVELETRVVSVGFAGGPTLPARVRPSHRADDGEGLVDAAVIAVGDDKDHRPAGDQAGQADGPSVGVEPPTHLPIHVMGTPPRR